MRALKPLIVLVTYNRPHHTQQVLEGIRHEGIRELTITMDAPANPKDSAAQEELLHLYEQIDWADITLLRRPRNTGLAHSIVDAVTQGLQAHEAIILLEDDCVPRPGFFDFMNKGLTYYQKKRKVRSLCGYQFPFVEDYKTEALTTIPLHRFTPWGWATWKDRWQDYTADLKKLVEQVANHKHFRTLGVDLQRYCTEEYYLNGKADIWSLNWVLTHYATDTLSIFPSRSLIDNIGFDGTGVHSIKTHAFEVHRQRPRSYQTITLAPKPQLDEKAAMLIDSYLDRHSREVMIKQLPKLV